MWVSEMIQREILVKHTMWLIFGEKRKKEQAGLGRGSTESDYRHVV